MKRILNFISHYLTGVPDWVRKRKLLVLFTTVALTAFFVYGMSKLQFDFTVEKWLKQDDVAFVAYNDFHEQFGSDDGVVIVYKAKDGKVFSAESLKAVKGIRDDLVNYTLKLKAGEKSSLDHIVKVETIVNAPILTVKNDVMLSRWTVAGAVPTSAAGLEEIRKSAKAERDFTLKYFSKDEKYGVIYVKTDFGAIPMNSGGPAMNDKSVNMTMADPSAAGAGAVKEDEFKFKPTDMADYVGLNAAINTILNKPEYAGHLEYYRIGNTVDSENQVKMGQEMALLYMVGLIVMLVTLFVIFRSLAGILWPTLIIVLSTIWTFGIAGLIGLSISPFAVLTVLLILTIGIADVTHMTSSYLFFREEGHDSAAAMREAYEKAGLACFLTTITTIAGMMSLLSGSLVPVINFSLMSSIGVAAVFIMTMYLLPVLFEIRSPAPKVAKEAGIIDKLIERLMPSFIPALQRWLETIVPAVEKRPWAYIAPFALVLLASLYGTYLVKVDYSVYNQYAETSNFYQGIKLMDDKMGGSSQMSLYVDLGKEDGFQDPAVLRVIEGLQKKLETDYSKYVVNSASIVNVVKDAYQKQHDGREDMYLIPSNREALSQTLFTFNVANPEQREKLVSQNYQKANITVGLRGYGSYEYTKVFDLMRKDIDGALTVIKKDYPDATVSITGLFAMGMKAANYLVNNELQSFGLSLFVISIMLMVIFNSFKAGLISLIPNVIPSFLVLGVLGLLNIPLDFYTMMLAPIAVGIAVDDTIHFVSVYRISVLRDGDIRRALSETVKECGQSVVFASMILGFGFGVMSIATTPGLASLGKFGFLTIFAGLVCELFLTPALIMVFKLKFQGSAPALDHAHAPVH